MPRTTRAALRQLENEQSARPDAVKFGVDHAASLDSSQGENVVPGITKTAPLLNREEADVIRGRPAKASKKKKDLSFADEENLLPLTEVSNTPQAASPFCKLSPSTTHMSDDLTPSDLKQHVSGSGIQTNINTDHKSKEIAGPADAIAEMDALQRAITDIEQDLSMAQNMESSSRTNAMDSSMSDPSPLDMNSQQAADSIASIQRVPVTQSSKKHETIPSNATHSTTPEGPDQKVNDTEILVEDPNAEDKAKSPLPLYKRKPFVPKKSTRPPLTTNSVLPGEVFAAKLKAAKEEQQTQKTTKEKSPPKAFAANSRPPLKSTPPSGKRMSTLVKKSQQEPVTPNFVLPGELVAAKLKAAKEARELRAEANAMASTMALKAAPRPSVGLSSAAVRRTSMPVKSMTPGNNRSARPAETKSSPEDKKQFVPLQVAKRSDPRPSVGKVGGGTLISEQERADALRKARAEAAERGRLASKLWAEKKLAKKNHERQSAGEAVSEIQQ